ncbi:adenylosuccinate lyase [Bacteroidia bacterium]|nr:adenylosuccinate lyase [Bacteroidia bacterium]
MTTTFSPLTAVSPIDGRYHAQTTDLSDYCSEFALIRYRVRVEVEYFIALCELPLPQLKGIDHNIFPQLRLLYQNFTEDSALQIKAIERTTNHDVKAVEYLLKMQFEPLGLSAYAEFIHFGLTSQDINTSAVMLSTKEATHNVLLPALNAVQQQLAELAEQWKHVPMLAHTHGQPASPTQLGKELQVFVERLKNQQNVLLNVPFSTKFGGATGNFNAHKVAYPQINWTDFADKMVHNVFGLQRTAATTQIEPYDNIAAFFDAVKRLNIIQTDLCRDMWLYISMGYFKQKIKADEVGSSAMPHKINPIDFENAEGNFGIANALLEHFAVKLPISRLQRDLTDSTVLRNVGVALGHTLMAYKNVLKGLNKLLINEEKISADLENNWAVVAEGIQTVLRREGYPQPYEALKALTRGNQAITQASMHQFIDQLAIATSLKDELKAITPHNYV